MTTSYDPSLSTDKDWVRFYIGDTDLDPDAVDLQDEEILAVIADERNSKYLAAARCGEIIIARTQGVVSKNVDNLGLSFGDSPTSSFRSHLQKLREDGANRLTAKKNRVFRLL